MPTPDTTTLVQALRDVSKALDRASAASLTWPDDNDVLGALAEVPVLRNKLDALAGKVARAAEAGCAVNRDGCRNAAIWVGHHTGAAPKHIRADVRIARWLVGFGEFDQAHQAGVLSRDHIRLLRHADRPVTHLALIRDQEVLIETARTCSFEGFKVAVQYWINIADPDGDLAAEQIRDNELFITRRPDGSISLKGQLDPLLGTAVKAAIDAEFEKIATNDADISNVGDSVSRPRRPAQRAQALANLVSRGAARADGTLASPLINVVMSHHVAEDLAQGLVPHLDPDDIDGRCEFLDGTPLHPAFAAKLIPTAIFRRIVFDADSRPIDVSVNARLFPKWMKDVALTQTRGRCAEQGCDAPIHWLEADHKHPHSRGGPTALHNIQPICRPGNRSKRDRIPPDNAAEQNARTRHRLAALLEQDKRYAQAA